MIIGIIIVNDRKMLFTIVSNGDTFSIEINYNEAMSF